MNQSVTAIAAVVTGLFAWLLENVPVASQWWDSKFTSKQRQAIMQVVPLLLAGALLFASCEFPNTFLSCPEGGAEGVLQFLSAWFIAFVTGQGVHYGTKSKGV